MSSRSVHGYSEALPDRQALATILQTLKKHNLKATEETLLKEMGMSELSGSLSSASTQLPAALGDTEPAKCEAAYASPHRSHAPSLLSPLPPTSTKTLQSATLITTTVPNQHQDKEEREIEEIEEEEEEDEEEDLSTDQEDEEFMIVEHQRHRSDSSTPVDTEYQSPSSWPGTVNAKLAPKNCSPSFFSFKPSFVPMTAFDKTPLRVDNNKPLWFTSSPQQHPTTNTVASKPHTLISPTQHLPINHMIAGVAPSISTTTTAAAAAAKIPFMYQLAATPQGFGLHRPILATQILTVLPTAGLVRQSPSTVGSPQHVQTLKAFGLPIFGHQTSPSSSPSSASPSVKLLSTPPPRRSSDDIAKSLMSIRTPSVSSPSPVHFSAIAEPTTGQTLTSPMMEHMSVSSTGGRNSPPKTLASIPPSELTQQHLELKAFAEEFKTRRIQLGYTQGSVGQSLADRGFSNFAQSTISRFEQMQLSATNAAAIKQVLEKWLQEAECPSSADSTSSVPPMMAGRKRKKRAVFTSHTRGALEEFFKQNPRPNRQIIEAISQQLDLLPEEVRVWFCNKRQKEKQSEGVQIISGYSFDKDTCLSTSSSGANSPSSLYEPSPAKFSSPSPKSTTSFTIEELSKSSSNSTSGSMLNTVNFTSSPGVYSMITSSHKPAMTYMLGGSQIIAQTKA